MSSDVVVIGAGISGWTTALGLRRAGATVTLVTKGVGGLPLSNGTLDVLGRLGGAAGPAGPGAGATLEERSRRRAVTHPYAAVADTELLPEGHPYRVLGPERVRRGVDELIDLVGEELLVRPEATADPAGPANLWLPTAVGAVRPTAVIQPSMRASVLRDGGRYLVVGLARLKDLAAELVAGNLNRTELPGGGRVEARAVTVDLEIRPGDHDTSAVEHARALDAPAVADRLAKAVAPHLRDGETVLLPAVLGLADPAVAERLAERLGAPVGEIPLTPPSVPGLRLENRLSRLAVDERVRVVQGGRVIDSERAGGRLVSVSSASAGHPMRHRAGAVVLAAGGFESGALTMTSHGEVTDTVLGLPLAGVSADGDENLRRLIHSDYWGSPQGLFRTGVAVDAAMHPLGPDGAPALANVHAVGGVLAGAVRWSEKSGEGIALGSARAALDALAAGPEADTTAAPSAPSMAAAGLTKEKN